MSTVARLPHNPYLHWCCFTLHTSVALTLMTTPFTYSTSYLPPSLWLPFPTHRDSSTVLASVFRCSLPLSPYKAKIARVFSLFSVSFIVDLTASELVSQRGGRGETAEHLRLPARLDKCSNNVLASIWLNERYLTCPFKDSATTS